MHGMIIVASGFWLWLLCISGNSSLLFIFVIVCGFFFIWSESVQVFFMFFFMFFCFCLYLYWCGRIGIPLTGLTPPHCLLVPSQNLDFQGHTYAMVFFIFTAWFEVRSDCLICWYWWNCWQSLFKLSFYNSVETYNINFLRAISNTLCKRCPLWNVPSCVKCTVTSCDDRIFSVERILLYFAIDFKF